METVATDEQGGKVSHQTLAVGGVEQLQSSALMNIPGTACESEPKKRQ